MIQIDPWGADSLRVRIGESIIAAPTVQALLDVHPDYADTNSTSTIAILSETPCSISNGNINATISQSGQVTICRVTDGTVLVQELYRSMDPLSDAGLFQARFGYAAGAPDERVYGLGEHRTGALSYANYSWQFEDSLVLEHNGDFNIPFYQSSRGFGFLWNMASFGHVMINDTHREWFSNATQQIDFWVTTSSIASKGPTAYPAIMQNYIFATGRPSMVPSFATGFWQCKLRYRNQTEILAAAKGYKDRGLPISVIVVDFFHWDAFGDWSFDESCWPDPSAMTKQLAEWGISLMVSVWPHMAQRSDNFAAADAQGLLVKDYDGEQVSWTNFGGDDLWIYDSFNANARQFLWQKLHSGYFQHNVSVFWLDACEPQGAQPGKMLYAAGKDTQVGLAYPRFHQQAIYDGLWHETPVVYQPISLSRAAWAGSQRYGAAVWSGDIESTFEELTIQVKVAQNVAMSGIYLWTTDIGGFRNGDINDPQWRELIVRWFQFGAFCPLFRLHGDRDPALPTDQCGETGGYNEIWEFGEPAFSIIADIMRLRETLRPYIEQQLSNAMSTGVPLLRPMVFDFSDPECATADNQFMFGPDWLVAPVTTYQAKTWSVYLPRLQDDGTQKWQHYYTKKVYTGGQRVVVSVPLAQFPLFQRVIVQ